MDNYVLIMTYDSLTMRSLKYNILIRHEVFKDDCVIIYSCVMFAVRSMSLYNDSVNYDEIKIP